MRVFTFGLIILILAVFPSCKNSKEQSEVKRTVSVSILPQKYFVEALAGDSFEVNVMIPPGTSPASYDPNPRQLKDLGESDLYLKIGNLGFEKAWMGKIKNNHKDLKIIDLSAGIDPVETNIKHGDHSHIGVDPHIWMSPKSALKMAENTANAIIRFDPVCKDLIRENLEKLKGKISELDREFTVMAAELEIKKFIIFHPALTYLARDYGLEQIPMEFEGKQPSAAYMKEIIDKARAENIKLVFIQKEFDQSNAKQISKDLNARLVQIDPLTEDWMGMMLEVLESFDAESL